MIRAIIARRLLGWIIVFPRRAAVISSIAAVVLAVSFIGLGARELWNPVEPRYAGIAAELVRDGHYALPRYNGEIYDQKPPLFFWAGAGLLKLFPDDLRLWAVRLPSALGAVLLVLASFVMGRRLFDRTTGAFAALFTATSWLVFWSSRFCHIDTLMSAAIVWTTWGAECARKSTGRARIAAIVGAAAAASAGILLKGVTALVFPLTAHLIAALRRRERPWIAAARAGFFWIGLAALAVFALWLAAARADSSGGWAKEMIWKEGMTRLVDREETDKHSVVYYLGVVWAMMAPWILLLPPAVFFLSRRARPDAERDAERFLSSAWLGVFLLLVLSAITGASSRSRYLLPLVCPGTILAARFLVTAGFAGERGGARRSAAVVAGIVGAAITIVGVAVILHPLALRPIAGAQAAVYARELGMAARAAGVLVLMAGLSAIFALVRGRLPAAFVASILGLAILCGGWGAIGAPAVDRVRGDRALIREISRVLTPDRRFMALGGYAGRESTPGFFGFYLGRRLDRAPKTGKELEALFTAEPVVLLARERTLAGQDLPDEWSSYSVGPFGFHRVCIFVNPWPPHSSPR